MLIKVSLDELVQARHLDYSLYSASGELLYEAGREVTSGELLQFKYLSLYRNPEVLPVEHEGLIYSETEQPLTPEEQRLRCMEDAQSSIYGPEMSHSFVESIRYFWDGMANGSTPDIALCELIRDKLVAEVTRNVDQIFYLSQLRVRDEYTYSHTLNVCALSIALAIKSGFSQQEIKDIGLAAILHDLGKLLIPKSIMFKPGRLTEKEFEVMKLHPGLGYKIICQELRLSEAIARPALEHQEMYGGGGYPLNIQADEIHPYSQIVKVADVYDALTSVRPYKGSIPSHKAIKIMRSEGDKSFNPELLQTFIKLANFQEENPA